MPLLAIKRKSTLNYRRLGRFHAQTCTLVGDSFGLVGNNCGMNTPDAPHLTTVRSLCLAALAEPDIERKATAVRAIAVDALPTGSESSLTEQPNVPGRPARPLLVPPKDAPRRALGSVEGRAALIHALAHIEFNAINLALDVTWRFSGLPDAFYREWAHVAREEAYHFMLLREHLLKHGHDYGDFPAHNGLWEMAEKTKGDLLARLALVPRTLEARGLDASPAIRSKLAAVGDHAGAAILDIILRDEIGHVAVGNRWYRYVCNERELDPIATYAQLAEQYRAPKLRGPFNREARLAAGFEAAEIDAL